MADIGNIVSKWEQSSYTDATLSGSRLSKREARRN